MLHGGEPLVHGRADGAVDERARQVGVAHQRAPGQEGVLVHAADVGPHQRRQPVGPGDALELTPPARHNQGDVEPCRKDAPFITQQVFFE